MQFNSNPDDYTNAFTQEFNVLANSSLHYVLTVNPQDPISAGLKYLNPVLSAENVLEKFGTSPKPLNSVWHWRLSYQGTTAASIDISDPRLILHSLNFTGISDQWGQYTDKTWTDKIKSNSDFAVRLSAEKSDLAAHPGTGETLGSKSLTNPTPTLGKWAVVTYGNGMKFLQHPNGKLFWSVGLNGIDDSLATRVQDRSAYFKSLPSTTGTYANCYSVLKTPAGSKQCFSFRAQNLMMKYGSSYMTAWTAMVKSRLASWGINTIGIDSDSSLLNSTIPFTFDLSTKGFGTRVSPPDMKWGSLPDPFASDFPTWCQTNFKTLLAPYVANQNLMGVFVDNELSWGSMDSNALRYNISLGVLKSPSTQPAKVAFIAQLQQKYPTIAALNTSWGTNLASFSAMLTTTSWTPKYTAGQVADFQKFDTGYGNKYFYMVKGALGVAGLKSLYLGCRFADYTNEVVTSASGYVDVLSFNMYRYYQDVPWDYFDSLSKPVLISEFAYTLRGQGTFGGPASMPGPSGRANAITSFFNGAIHYSNIIGAQYYCYADQPITGRWSDYENGGFGVVDVADTPYPNTVSALRTFTSTMYSTRGATTPWVIRGGGSSTSPSSVFAP
jgi:hypothetical protein